MLSKRCTYGLRAVLFLAAQESGDYVPIRQISESLAIPHAFLAKTLQVLTQRGVLDSLRGPHGGVALAQPPGSLTLKDIIEAIDGPALFEMCVLGLPGCGTQKPCPLHEQWKNVRGGIHTTLTETSVGALAERMADWRKTQPTANDVPDELTVFLSQFKTSSS